MGILRPADPNKKTDKQPKISGDKISHRFVVLDAAQYIRSDVEEYRGSMTAANVSRWNRAPAAAVGLRARETLA
jgi:hypothetical protein